MEGLRGSMRTASTTTMAIVALILVLSNMAMVESDIGEWCRFSCAFQCTFVPDRNVCLVQCLKNCQGGADLLGPAGHCNTGCISSSCFDSQPDVEKMHGCISSCSERCNKAYPAH